MRPALRALARRLVPRPLVSRLRRRPPPAPLDAERLVRNLYRGLLLREPDPEGMAHWTGRLRSGGDANEVVEAFLDSPECRGHMAMLRDLFVPPGHFYSPVVDRREAARHLDAIEAAPTPQGVPAVAIDRARVVETWHAMLPFMREAPFGERPGEGLRYGFDNPAFSWGDGSVLHAMLRLHRPRRLIEVGSGWSSACALDTIERCLDGACDITFIEPFPVLLRDLLGEAAARANILEMPVQSCPPETFDALAAGDVLFIDSTHVMKTGSDVCFELFEVLPRLASGVLVHVHDMFWPFEYPRAWAVDENRSWNELYAIRAFLMHNDAWEVLFFNDMMAKLERPLVKATYPPFLRNPGGGLWLRRR